VSQCLSWWKVHTYTFPRVQFYFSSHKMWLGVHRKVTSALCDLLHPTNVQLTVVAGNGQKGIRTFRSGLPGMFEFNWSSLLLFGWMLLCRLQHLLCSCVAYWRVTYRGVAPITSLYSWQLQHSTAVNMLFTGATELRNLHVLTCDSMHVVIVGQGFTYSL